MIRSAMKAAAPLVASSGFQFLDKATLLTSGPVPRLISETYQLMAFEGGRPNHHGSCR